MTMLMNGDPVDVSLPVDGPRSAEAYAVREPLLPGLTASPRLIFGGARIASSTEGDALADAIDALHAAWKAGFVMVDVAAKYGQAEAIVGQALSTWAGPAPIVATKAGHEGPRTAKYNRDGLDASFLRSTQRLGRKPDMLAIHEPEFCPEDEVGEAAEYVASLIEDGLIVAGGLGGGGVYGQGRFLRRARFSYAMTYLRVSAVSLQGLVDQAVLVHDFGAKFWTASPLHAGLLGDQFERFAASPPSHVEPVILDRARRVHALASELGMPTAQLALRFLLSMPAVDAVLCGPTGRAQWEDAREAFEAGPLATDAYTQLWAIAQAGAEIVRGG